MNADVRFISRDDVALEALSAFLSCPTFTPENAGVAWDHFAKYTAMRSFDYADAWIAERGIRTITGDDALSQTELLTLARNALEIRWNTAIPTPLERSAHAAICKALKNPGGVA